MNEQHETALVLRILARIQEHTYNDPITIPVLAAEFCIDQRKVKSCIEQLRRAGHKIGSKKTKPYGTFVARDGLDIHETASRLEKEGIQLLKRARELRDFGKTQPTVFEQLQDIPEPTGERAA